MSRTALALALAVVAGAEVADAPTSVGEAARDLVPPDSALRWQFDTGG